MCGPAGELDWMTWNWDERLNNYVTEITENVDHILLGRNLAEGFIPHWQKAAEEISADPGTIKMAALNKTVFSRTLVPDDIVVTTWKNTQIENGDLAKSITKLKNKPGGDLIAYGGTTFITNLVENGLIDEYHFFYNPIGIGKGRSFFKDLQAPLKLTLKESHSFPCGIVVNTYKNENSS